jgi:hypothetical protein
VEVQLPQQRDRDGQLVGRELLLGQPAPALVPEQIRRRAARDQVAVQDRMHLVLQPGPLAHDVRPAQHLAAAVNGSHLVALVRAGATFVNGKLVERPDETPQPEAA